MISDLGTVVTGDTPPRKNPEYYGDAYPFIKPTDMKVGQRLTLDYEEGYSVEGASKYRKKLIPAGSTAVVTIGSIGQKLTWLHADCFVNQAVNAVIPDKSKFDELYVYYLLKHNLHQVKQADTGASSGRENVSKSNFSALKVYACTDHITQRQIAIVLGDLDTAIETNQHRIALLEEAARRLFREWFVYLRFPGHESVTVVDGVPEGWERKPIGQLFQYHIGGGWGKDEYDAVSTEAAYVIRGTDIPKLRQGNAANVPLRYHPPKNLASRSLQDGDLVFEVSGGSRDQGVGRLLPITELLLEQFDKPIMCASFCKLIRPVQGASEYLALALSELRIKGELRVFENQSASNIVNFAFPDFCERQIAYLPEQAVLEMFQAAVRPIWKQMAVFGKQQVKLAETRDALLPKLMSGQLDVSRIKLPQQDSV